MRGELPPRTSACVCILLVRTNEGVGCVFHFGSSIWELYCCDAARSQSERPTPAGAAGNTAPSPIRAEHTHAANARWLDSLGLLPTAAGPAGYCSTNPAGTRL